MDNYTATFDEYLNRRDSLINFKLGENTTVQDLLDIIANSGAYDFNGSISGTSTQDIADAFSGGNVITELINSSLNTQAKTILGEYTFSGSGAIAIKTDENNGVWLSPTGILGKKLGVPTFTLGIDGSCTYAGTIAAAQIIAGQLVVGTNVGQGTAVTSGGVTTIIGSTVTTSYINALNITAASVAAENITGTYITGKTMRTDASGTFRLEVRKNTEAFLPNSLTWVNSSNQDLASIQGTTVGALQVYSKVGQTLALGDSSAQIGILNGGIVGNFIPAIDNYYTLGTSSKRWKILQYSSNVDYTSSQTVTITTGFYPKEVHFNGYIYYGAGNGKYGTTSGYAGVVSPSTGKCNCWTIEAVTWTILLGTYDYLGGNGTCYCYVSSWNSNGIQLTVVCPTNWLLSTNILIKG